jgi:DNA-binding transcriptional ArsR family regulator
MKPQGKHSHNAPRLGANAPNLGANTAHASAAEALFGRTRRAVLALLYGQPDESFHMRQVARAVGASQGAVQRELRRLADAGILTRSAEGRLVRYQANPQCPIFEELRGLLIKTAGVADVLRNALARLEDRVRLAVLFGSSANGTLRSASRFGPTVGPGRRDAVNEWRTNNRRQSSQVHPFVFCWLTSHKC